MMSGNPVLNEDTFDLGYDVEQDRRSVMTMESTVLKSATLVGITVVAATITWGMVQNSGMGAAMPWMMGGAIVGLVFALITIFKPRASPFTAPLYAVAQGLFLGAVSAVYNASFPATNPDGSPNMFNGIVLQAVGLTLGVLGIMLALYATRIIRVTPKLAAGIIAATGAVMLVYIASFVMGLFGITMPLLHESSPMGIGISVVIVGIAAFNLLLDFDLIERGVKTGAPKYMEWFAGFALLVTLIWLYLEILRLLAKLRSR